MEEITGNTTKVGLERLLYDEFLINRKQVWAETRFRMEMEGIKTKRYGKMGPQNWYLVMYLLKVFSLGLAFTGLRKKGEANALNIALTERTLPFERLPPAFDGFTLLHLSDLHLDGIVGLEEKVLSLLGDRPVDLCVFTGDYRNDLHGLHKHIVHGMERLVQGIRSRHGFVGILGNHDGCHMVNHFEKIGITMLVNDNAYLHHGGDKIRLIGTDDVHYYYTDQALHALEHAEDEFTIALVHSPELFDFAATLGVDLYLCGHTHAGQVCLPGGRPLLTHLNRGHQFCQGHWHYEGMQGVTSAGVGTSSLPVRFNSQGEVGLYTLRRQIAPKATPPLSTS